MENYPSSTSQSDILWDQYCEDLEKMHISQLSHLNAVGINQFRLDVYNNPNMEVGLSYIHPDPNLETMPQFKTIQEAYINAIV